MTTNTSEDKIVFFDGECGLCDRFVQWLIKRDKDHVLKFAALQGDTALIRFGPETRPPERWSIKFVDSNGTYLRSSAALRSIAAVGGPWKLAKALLIVPAFFRDWIYRTIASNRYRWFGKFDSCLLPGRALQERFLP